MSASCKSINRVGLGLLGVACLIVIAAVATQARISSAPISSSPRQLTHQMPHLVSTSRPWTVNAPFYYRVNFTNSTDLDNYTKPKASGGLWSHTIRWAGDDGKTGPTWDNWTLIYKDTAANSAIIQVTTTQPTLLVAPTKIPGGAAGAPAPKTEPGFYYGTGTATVVMTDDTKKKDYPIGNIKPYKIP